MTDIVEKLTHPNCGSAALRRAVEILNREKGELAADNERLQTHATSMIDAMKADYALLSDDYKQLQIDNEKLRALYDKATDQAVRYADDIEQLRGHKEEADRHIKTIAELRAEMDKAWTKHLIEREELKAEVERLKAERNTTKRMLNDIIEKHIPR